MAKTRQVGVHSPFPACFEVIIHWEDFHPGVIRWHNIAGCGHLLKTRNYIVKLVQRTVKLWTDWGSISCCTLIIMLYHNSAVCSSCFYHIQNLRRIRRYLDLDGAKLLVTALLSSRLDYCNSLLYGIADTGPCCDKVTSFYSQCSPISFPSVVASKI